MAKCRSCQAKVTWCITDNGKTMPVDPNPDPKGNLIRTGNVVDGKLEVHAISSRDVGEELKSSTRYMSHFATCPQAASHRLS